MLVSIVLTTYARLVIVLCLEVAYMPIQSVANNLEQLCKQHRGFNYTV